MYQYFVMNSITIIGAGNMGSAIALALLEKNIFSAQNITVIDSNVEKLKPFSHKGCTVSTHAEEYIPKSRIVLLAVKPQAFPDILESWKHLFDQNTIILSIAAGVSIEKIKLLSGAQKIARIMPNTPAQIGFGVSGIYCSSGINTEEKENIRKIAKAFGIVIECRTENAIDAITALSGSGPAYFFRILEILQKSGENFGFSTEESKNIALHTLLGAGMLAKQSSESFTQLRENVTSKGGTTAAALESFEKNDLKNVLQTAIQKAYQRAQELS